MNDQNNAMDDEILRNERDVSTLKRHMRRLLGEIRKLKGKPATEEVDETPRDKFIRENAPRLKPFEAGTPQWQAELDKIMADMEPILAAEGERHGAELQAKVARLSTSIEKETLRQAATRIAVSLAKPGSSDVLLPHITARLRTKWDGDECQVEVTGADGDPSSEDSLLAEFREMRPEFAAIVQGASEDDKIAHAKRVAATLGKDPTKAQARTLTRAEFDALDPLARAHAMSDGAKVVEH